MYDFPAGPELPPEMMGQPRVSQAMPQLTQPGQNISPAMINAVIGLGSSPEKRAALLRQMDQVQALRNPQHPANVYQTGWGAGLAGVGDVIRQIAAGNKERGLLAQEKNLSATDEETRKRYGNSLIEALRGTNAAPQYGQTTYDY